MDSRSIYTVSLHLISEVEWAKKGDSEWIYCGTAREIMDDVIEKEVYSFLEGDLIYVATT